jgi:hypothetical protein
METISPSSSKSATALAPNAQQRGWWRRNSLRLLVCIVVVIGGAAVAGYLLKFGPILFSTPYREAMADLRLSPQVKKMLGEPLHDGWFPSGNVSAEDGEARFNFRVHGPKAADDTETIAHVAVQARFIGGKWGFTQFDMQPENGQKLNLIDWTNRQETPDVKPFDPNDQKLPAPTKAEASNQQNVDIQIPGLPTDSGQK